MIHNQKIKAYGSVDSKEHTDACLKIAADKLMPIFDIIDAKNSDCGKRPDDKTVKEMIDSCFVVIFGILNAEVDCGKVTLAEAEEWFDGWRDSFLEAHFLSAFKIYRVQF